MAPRRCHDPLFDDPEPFAVRPNPTLQNFGRETVRRHRCPAPFQLMASTSSTATGDQLYFEDLRPRRRPPMRRRDFRHPVPVWWLNRPFAISDDGNTIVYSEADDDITLVGFTKAQLQADTFDFMIA